MEISHTSDVTLYGRKNDIKLLKWEELERKQF
jgi:hypothetical protein